MYNYGTPTLDNTLLSSLFAFLWTFALIAIAISVFYTIVMWKIFKKAGQPGWAALIPIYNIVIMLKIAKMPLWWLALLLIPVVNGIGAIAFGIVWSLQLAKVFGKDTTFGVLTIFFNFVTLPILAFGDAKYLDETDTDIPTEPVQPMRPSVEPIVAQPTQPMTQQPVQPNVAPQPVQPTQQTVAPVVQQEIKPIDSSVESFMPEMEEPVQPSNQNNIQ